MQAGAAVLGQATPVRARRTVNGDSDRMQRLARWRAQSARRGPAPVPPALATPPRGHAGVRDQASRISIQAAISGQTPPSVRAPMNRPT